MKWWYSERKYSRDFIILLVIIQKNTIEMEKYVIKDIIDEYPTENLKSSGATRPPTT